MNFSHWSVIQKTSDICKFLPEIKFRYFPAHLTHHLWDDLFRMMQNSKFDKFLEISTLVAGRTLSLVSFWILISLYRRRDQLIMACQSP